MKKRVFFIPTFALIIVLFFHNTASAEIVDRIVAVVNNEIITLSELKKFSSLVYGGVENKNDSSSKKTRGAPPERRILDQLIEKKLIAQEAKKNDITVTDRELSEALENILSRNKITLDQLKQLLKNEGGTFEDYREILRSEILQSKVIGREIRSRITITEKDIKKYYNEHIKPKEGHGERVRIQQILLLIQQDSTPQQIEQVRKDMIEIRKRVLAGEDFGKLAATYSQGPGARTGGDLGYFRRGEMLPPIEQAAFSLNVGEISRIIQTSIGLHLIKVLDKLTGQQEDGWKGRKDEIRELLYMQEIEKRYGEWLEELKKNSYIEINF